MAHRRADRRRDAGLRGQLAAVPHGAAARQHRRRELLQRAAGLGSAGAGGDRAAAARPGWVAAAMLFAYVGLFSFAYRSLGAGTGALILFGAVQLTMFGAGLRAGERFSPLAWLGFVLAVAGLVWLVSPGLAAPPLL